MTPANCAAWTLERARYRPGGAARATVDNVSFEIPQGRTTAVIGPNGAGKTTLLRLLLGTIALDSGSIAFRGRAVAEWTRRAFAREIAVVPQGETESLFTVREIVAMGRYPHLGPWQRERTEDAAAITRAMDRCDVTHFAERWMATLSGGEQQRVRLARAIAQDASVLVLDEPTTFLDIRHEMTTFELLRQLRADGATIVVATHNLNLAARYADDLVLMRDGKLVAHGAPADVLTASRVEATYDWPVDIASHVDGSPQVVPQSAVAPC
jgi:iron complex transport system ATP-binding protein